MDKTTLPLWNEPKHNYVAKPTSYRDKYWAGRPMDFGVRPFSRPKTKNFTQTKYLYFSILYAPAKYQASRFNNKKIEKFADPLFTFTAGYSSHVEFEENTQPQFFILYWKELSNILWMCIYVLNI